jgi:hypothetical protein
VVAFLIQNVAIAHPKDAEGKTGRRLRLVGIGMVVASLFSFRGWNHRGGERTRQFNWSLDLTDLADYCRRHLASVPAPSSKTASDS